MSTLEKALSLAALAHEGQKDKAGSSYILHPLRVMLSLPEGDARIVAILHDILEDTSVTMQDLEKLGFSREILTAIEAITHNDNESYNDYIDRCGRNRLAAIVKLADLQDNADLSRIANPGERDRKRVERYRMAIIKLERVIGGSSQ